MEDKLITFAKYEMLHDAEFVKDVLVENGIRAMVVGEMLSNCNMYVVGARTDCVEVKIFAGDLEQANSVIEEYNAEHQNEQEQ